MSSPVLEVRHLRVSFELESGREVRAVQDVSFDLLAGERLGLVGESGCGKTTVLLALMGLLPANAKVEGVVGFAGKNLLSLSERELRRHRWRDIAVVFQGAMNAFNPVVSIESQIAEVLRLHDVNPRRAARGEARELLERVGISSRRGRSFPHELSGGMRQRAALAMAVACRPKVLLADEPTTALDVVVQAQILQLLVDLSAEFELALVFVTHDLPVVFELCTRAAVMYAGRIVEMTTVQELCDEQLHPYSRLLFRAVPDLHDQRDVASIPGAPPRLDQPMEGCAFSPRCDVVFDPCSSVFPHLQGTSRSRVVACHRLDPAWSESAGAGKAGETT